MQVFQPDKFQAYVLGQRGEDSVVQAPKQLAFTDFYMPATAELTKDVFAEEASGTITQGLAQEGGYTAFGKHSTPHGRAAAVWQLVIWEEEQAVWAAVLCMSLQLSK